MTSELCGTSYQLGELGIAGPERLFEGVCKTYQRFDFETDRGDPGNRAKGDRPARRESS